MSWSWTGFLKEAEQFLPIAMYLIPGGALPAAAVPVANALPSIVADIKTTMDPATPNPVRKQAAMIAAKQVTQTIAAASTGGQAATWNEISGKVSTLIDALVSAANQAEAANSPAPSTAAATSGATQSPPA